MDIDTLHAIKAEDHAYNQWEREQKNTILSMTNPQRKQEKWNQLFPQMTHSDSYLLGNIF